MKFSKVIGIALLSGATVGAAQAAQISGSIGFSGVGSTWAYNGVCTTTANCNGFTLNPSSPAINIEVDASNGNFNIVGSQVGDDGVMKDVDVNALPVASQWTMGAFTFDLETATILFVLNDPNGAGQFLNISGTGTVYGGGYDPTFGRWSWTGSSSGADLTFAATTRAVPVPEPLSLALVGIALFAAGVVSKRGVK